MDDTMLTGTVSREPGNTPLKNVPTDYYPAGCGFWFVIPDGPDNGKKMFYRDSSFKNGTPKKTIVLVHGNPECSYSYRKIIGLLERGARKPCRIIAMDHVGFGLSDQADYEMACPDHAANLLHLIEHLNLIDVTLVVHDWGGPIGIGAFLKAPERVANLVILNTTVFPIQGEGFQYHKNYPVPVIPWSRFPSVFPDFLWGSVASYTVYRRPANAFRLIGVFIAYLILSRFGIRIGREKEARQVYEAQFGPRTNARSSKRMVRETTDWGKSDPQARTLPDLSNSAAFFRFIHENIEEAWGPEGKDVGARALIGRWDPLGKDEVIRQWIHHLPQLHDNVRIFSEVGHFVNIEKPEEIADSILDVAGLK